MVACPDGRTPVGVGRAVIAGNRRITGLWERVPADLVVEVGPVWQARREQRLRSRSRRREMGAGPRTGWCPSTDCWPRWSTCAMEWGGDSTGSLVRSGPDHDFARSETNPPYLAERGRGFEKGADCRPWTSRCRTPGAHVRSRLLDAIQDWCAGRSRARHGGVFTRSAQG